MAKWRALEEYTPFARLLVASMWEQRPPLVPTQFADRMGVRKQALSTWLTGDAVPAPPVVVRLARGMGRPVRDLMTAAGYAPADDPLLDHADAWAYVRAAVERVLDGESQHEASLVVDATLASPAGREAVLALLRQLQDQAVATARVRLQMATMLNLDPEETTPTPGDAAEHDASTDGAEHVSVPGESARDGSDV